MTDAADSDRGEPVGSSSILGKISWEKLLVWGAFLTAIYLLRHFFFIILMTFLFCFVIRGVVVRCCQLLSPKQERPWLERLLAILCFLSFLGGLLLAGEYLGPKVILQGQELLIRFTRIDAEQEFQRILDRTVGAYLFHRDYGDDTDPRFRQEFSKQVTDGALFAEEYHDFPTLRATIEGAFEANFERTEGARLRAHLVREGIASKEFETWLKEERAPRALEEARVARLHPDVPDVVSMPITPPPTSTVDTEAKSNFVTQVKEDPVLLGKLHDEWKDAVVRRQLADLRDSPEYTKSFREYYDTKRKVEPSGFPFDFDTFLQLRDAYPQGEQAFAKVLNKGVSRDRESEMRGFQLSMQRQLADQWWRESSAALFIRHHVTTNLGDLSAEAATYLQKALAYGLTIPVQLGMALLLSFFIMIDYPNLKRGTKALHGSRIGKIYDEIAPSLVRLGRLIGVSFYAQAIVAVFNALLTLVALYILGIDHAFALMMTVFVCSFIPVLGVVLSGLPIAIVAIVQPGGSLTLASYAIVAMIIIHLLESMVFSPRIVGSLMHLHPVVVFVVLLIGEHFFGFWGLLLGVPVAVYLISSLVYTDDSTEHAAG
ncbi:MAG: AI-2E family transporter [Planctomycetota bacterium]